MLDGVGAMLVGAERVEGVREIGDAESFAAACAEIWKELERRELDRATSVGEFMDRLNEAAFNQLDGALLSFERE